jgi:hypothetical protein
MQLKTWQSKQVLCTSMIAADAFISGSTSSRKVSALICTYAHPLETRLSLLATVVRARTTRLEWKRRTVLTQSLRKHVAARKHVASSSSTSTRRSTTRLKVRSLMAKCTRNCPSLKSIRRGWRIKPATSSVPAA